MFCKKPISNKPRQEYQLQRCGDLVELDILVVTTPSSKVPKSYGGFKHVVLVVDVFPSFLTYVPMKSMSKPQRFIDAVVTKIQNAGHPIKHLKLDVQFNKDEVTTYLDSFHISYQFSPPYEHEFIGCIERNNRTKQDKLTCALAISSANNKSLWLFALSDAIEKLNVVPRRNLNWPPTTCSGLVFLTISLISLFYHLAVGSWPIHHLRIKQN